MHEFQEIIMYSYIITTCSAIFVTDIKMFLFILYIHHHTCYKLTGNMPGRRRKRNVSDARWPSLKFTVSPEGVSLKVMSPVYANDDPPTANVVPIDEDTSLSWVSDVCVPLNHWC